MAKLSRKVAALLVSLLLLALAGASKAIAVSTLPFLFGGMQATATSTLPAGAKVGPAQVSNGLSFQCWVSQGRIVAKPAVARITSFGLLITNISKKPIRLSEWQPKYEGLVPDLIDSKGRSINPYQRPFISTHPVPSPTEADYRLLKPGDKIVFSLSAVANVQDGLIVLSPLDLGQWYFRGLRPDRYRITFAFDAVNELPGLSTADRKSHLPISGAWVGAITPSPVSFEIARN